MNPKDQEATPKEGVEGTEDNAAPKSPVATPLDTRTEVDDIVARRRALRDQEDEPVDEPADEPVDEPADEEFVTVKVDGVEQQVPLSKVQEAGIRTLQKESAADKRLEEAARLRAEAEAALNAAQEAQQRLQQQQVLLPSPPEPDAEELKAVTEEVTSAIYSGDEEELKKAIAKLATVQAQQPQVVVPPVPQEEIAAVVHSTFEAERQRAELEAAQRQFAKDFPELDSDPDLRELTNLKTAAIQQAHPDWTFSEIITHAGNEVRSKLAREPEKSDPLENRRSRKRQAAKQPQSAGVRVPKKPEPKPLTRSDIVREMQKRRPV